MVLCVARFGVSFYTDSTFYVSNFSLVKVAE